MSNTTKSLTDYDSGQTLQIAFNDKDGTISTNGFLVGVVGRKVVCTISTTSVTGDTQTYAFSENGVALYSLKLIYTDNTYSLLVSAERTV